MSDVNGCSKVSARISPYECGECEWCLNHVAPPWFWNLLKDTGSVNEMWERLMSSWEMMDAAIEARCAAEARAVREARERSRTDLAMSRTQDS